MMMPKNRLDTSTFTVCVVFLLSLWPALPATAQRVLTADTLLMYTQPNLRSVQLLAVQDDTLIVRTGGAGRPILFSTNGGATFDSKPLPALNFYPRRRPTKGTILTTNDNTRTYIARDGKNFVEQEAEAYGGPPSTIINHFPHPHFPETTFVRNSNGNAGNRERTWVYYRDNDTARWQFLKPPDARSGGIGHRYQVHCDYGRPERLWIILDPEEQWAEDFTYRHEVYYSDNMGKSWTFVRFLDDAIKDDPFLRMKELDYNQKHFSVGVIRKDWVVMGTFKYEPRQFLLGNMLAGEIDSVPELMESIKSAYGLNETQSTVAIKDLVFYHADCLNVFMVLVDFIDAAGTVTHTKHLVTGDSGLTWSEIVRPAPVTTPEYTEFTGYSVTYASVSCSSRRVIAVLRTDRLGSDNRSTTVAEGLVSFDLSPPLSVNEGNVQATTSCAVVPNPTSGFAVVTCSASNASGISIVDPLGRNVTTTVDIAPQSVGQYSVDFGTLHNGLYYILISTPHGHQALPIVVQR